MRRARQRASRRSRERNGAPRRTRPGRSDDDAPAADRPSSPRSTDSGPRAASAAPSPWRRRTRTARRAGCGRARVGRTQQSRSCRRCVRHSTRTRDFDEPARGVDRSEENKTLVRSARSTRARPHRSARTHDAMPKSLGKRSRSGEATRPRAPTCPHGKANRGYLCKECPGKGICEHGRQRSKCKECGGASICEHGRVRSKCKECGAGSICEHGRERSKCKECGGGNICEHGRVRSVCKECGGSQICEHGRERSKCKECVRSSRVDARDAKPPIAPKVEIKEEFEYVEDPGEEDYSLQ